MMAPGVVQDISCTTKSDPSGSHCEKNLAEPARAGGCISSGIQGYLADIQGSWAGKGLPWRNAGPDRLCDLLLLWDYATFSGFFYKQSGTSQQQAHVSLGRKLYPLLLRRRQVALSRADRMEKRIRNWWSHIYRGVEGSWHFKQTGDRK